jgi:hypothetical protein
MRERAALCGGRPDFAVWDSTGRAGPQQSGDQGKASLRAKLPADKGAKLPADKGAR